MVHIAYERVHRSVPTRGVLVHGLGAEHVQIVPVGATRAKAGRATVESGDRNTRGVACQNQALHFARRLLWLVRELSGNQFIEDHPQRIDVGVDADPIAAELFGRGVGGGHHPETGLRVMALGKLFELLGDPEVEELHGAVGRHENVRWLHVAMHDEVLVGVNDRFADGAEQAQAITEPEAAGTAGVGDGHPFDMLHHDPRRAIVERTGVKEPRDRRVVELREEPLLCLKSLAASRRDPGIPEHFHCRGRPQIVPLGQVDDTGATLA
jgi:hypothetical protein